MNALVEIPGHSWAREAACRDHPEPDLWFPTTEDGGPGNVQGEIAKAKKICRSCPVRVECLEYALVHERWGIWGGTSERDRRRIRRERARERRVAA